MKFLFVCLGLFSIGCANNGDLPEMAAETADTTGTVVAAIYHPFDTQNGFDPNNRIG